MAKTPEKSLPLALELLSSDHRKVEELFREFEDMKEAEDDSRIAVAQKICAELTVHAQVEEELIYPWIRENIDETDMIAEAEVEHASLKQLIAEIEPIGEPDEAFDAKVKVLGEYIRHHVNEEENEMFPKVRDMQEELDELGQELAARKAEIRAEMGLPGEDEGEPGAKAPPGGGKKKPGNSQRASR